MVRMYISFGFEGVGWDMSISDNYSIHFLSRSTGTMGLIAGVGPVQYVSFVPLFGVWAENNIAEGYQF